MTPGLNATAGAADAGDDALRRVISRRLSLEAPPGLEGGVLAALRLYRATPSSGLSRLIGGAPPYWAHPWAGGLALARHLACHPEVVAGRSLLDLGCGGGLVALSAAMSGARAVTGIDIDPWAVAAAGLNAEANGLAATFLCGEATAMALPTADIVTAGDLFYEGDLAERMLVLLRRLAGEGTTVLIGDPGRASLPADRMQRIATYAVADFGAFRGSASAEGGVYRL